MTPLNEKQLESRVLGQEDYAIHGYRGARICIGICHIETLTSVVSQKSFALKEALVYWALCRRILDEFTHSPAVRLLDPVKNTSLLISKHFWDTTLVTQIPQLLEGPMGFIIHLKGVHGGQGLVFVDPIFQLPSEVFTNVFILRLSRQVH
jgi:hypothetical protein